MNQKVDFIKMHGAGNDLIFIDEVKNEVVQEFFREDLARRICVRNVGIGSDGIIFVRRSSHIYADFDFIYHNPDGSRAEICVNGLRCFAKLVFDRGYTKKESIKINTDAGIVEASVTKTINNKVKRVKLKLGPPILNPVLIPVKERLLDTYIEGIGNVTSVGMGNPHAIIIVNDVYKVDVIGIGKVLRNNLDIFPRGANVNFLSYSNDYWHIRTYERGVEDETLACGSGMLASAVALLLLKKVPFGEPINIKTKVGFNLTVTYTGDNPENITNIFLEGPAETVFEGCVVL
jgi:diaminopimelate epimerase